ncbi:hypothetical protein VSS37_03690 [Candidatus Thiothrix sp. Deng01]|uniref:Uncharacterized protein n=1 Tax=Candidatus Thiothrix phosphatis TaxID=3112415 RepID=A0ABU6CVJ6_9GAMM|nr:hypothetical protein [Candidatus Thiothrix sp. Deng01]MEB4590073.1 hypothetical protein [Candidatus Thiothrix sp. Deng01]
MASPSHQPDGCATNGQPTEKRTTRATVSANGRKLEKPIQMVVQPGIISHPARAYLAGQAS